MSNEISTKTVTFLYDGETVATVETPVGEFPTVPEIGAKKEGYRLMWLGSDKAVEEDTVCVAYEVLGNPTQLLYSLSSPLLAYPADKADNQGNVFGSSMCILYLTAEVRHNPENEIFRARVVEHLKHFVNHAHGSCKPTDKPLLQNHPQENLSTTDVAEGHLYSSAEPFSRM